MKILHRLGLVGILFCAGSMGALTIGIKAPRAQEGNPNAQVAGTPLPVQEASGPVPQASLNISAGQQLSHGVIYAPKDVVDLTRLVLETNRDQNSHLAHYIERATTVIVLLFSLLAAAAAVFGLKKLQDVDEKAQKAIKSFEDGLAKSREKVGELEAEFKQSIDVSAHDIHRELNDQIELISARAEIDQSQNGGFDELTKNRMLMNASKRIQRVLDGNAVSARAKVRALADLGFIKKRLGDIEGAYAVLMQAISLVGPENSSSLPLLTFNAACYASLLKKPDACTLLEAAIALRPEYKDLAKTDGDFGNIKEQPQFIALMT